MLGHELRRYQTALVLWSDEGAQLHATDRLEVLADDLAAAMGARHALKAPCGPSTIWAWVGTERAPDAAVLVGVPALSSPQHLRAAVGRPRARYRGGGQQ